MKIKNTTLIKVLSNCFIFILILIFILIVIMIMILMIITIHITKMETIFMNTENSKTSESHRFKLDLVDKLNPKKTWL